MINKLKIGKNSKNIRFKIFLKTSNLKKKKT